MKKALISILLTVATSNAGVLKVATYPAIHPVSTAKHAARGAKHVVVNKATRHVGRDLKSIAF